jgi:hypothetical protein
MTKRHLLFLLPLTLSLTASLTATGCSQIAREQAGAQAAEARQAWAGNWHGVWSIEFENAPVDGPLVAEMWHAADWFYDLRQNRAESGPADLERIPIASDSLLVMDWLLAQLPAAAILSARSEALESGPATRLSLNTEGSDQAELWINTKTGLPAGLELQSRQWGKVSLTSRSLEAPRSLNAGLFEFQPPADAEILYR